jgi:hypothetical protein
MLYDTGSKSWRILKICGESGLCNCWSKRSTDCPGCGCEQGIGVNISIGVVEASCRLNTLNIRDRDKLRQQRNRNIQSKCLENNREQVND